MILIVLPKKNAFPLYLSLSSCYFDFGSNTRKNMFYSISICTIPEYSIQYPFESIAMGQYTII